MGFPRQEQWSGLPCAPPGDVPRPRARTCVSGISRIGRQVLYQLRHLLVFYKEGSGGPLPTCVRNCGWGRHRQPVQLGSETSYLKHQHSAGVKVSALPASPWPPPPFRRQPNAQAVSWAFKHLPKSDIPPSPPQRSSQGSLKTFPR